MRTQTFKTVAAAIVLTVALAACDTMSGRETPGEYVDDTVITSKVIAAIVQDETLKKSQVSVETMERVVQLSGFVDSAQVASRAGDVARKVAGVHSVKNNLVVQ
jgi:hyperosmotically inducible periplasmic protein